MAVNASRDSSLRFTEHQIRLLGEIALAKPPDTFLALNL
jgi:hypothetical protein